MTETVPMGNFQATVFAWGGGSPFDLSSGAIQIFHSSQIPTEENDWNTGNYSRWSNSEYDEAISAANSTVQMAKLIPNLKIAMKIWTEQLPAIFLLNWVDHTYVSLNVKSYRPFPYKTWTSDFAFVYKE